MKIFYIVNTDKKTMDGCVYYRNYLPALYLTASGNHDAKLSNQFHNKSEEDEKTKQIKTYWDISFIMESDIIVFSRLYAITDYPMIKVFVEAAKHFGKKIVYETDDNFFDLPSHNKVWEAAIQSRELILYMMRNADAYTVTTKRLGEVLNRIYEKPTYVLPNSVEMESHPDSVYKKQVPVKEPGMIRIGWTGGSTHVKDLQVFSSALKRVLKKHSNVEFYNFSSEYVDRNVFNYPHNHIGLVPVEIYHDVLRDMDLDIAVTPLIGDKFNASKSAIKWTEFSMCKYATIYSAVPPYSDAIEDGVTGLAVTNNTKKAWIAALEKLIFDADLRRSIANNAHAEVYSKYNMEYNFLLWENAYKEVLKNESNNVDAS